MNTTQYQNIEYKLVQSKTTQEHQVSVQELLDSGWCLHGILIVNSKGFFIQQLSKQRTMN